MSRNIRFSKDGATDVLVASQWLPRPVTAIFPFFADATNLEQLTPEWLKFRVVTPLPIEMCAGTIIDYRLRLHGLPIRWRSRITHFVENEFFVDEQLRGPYKVWHHEHRFESARGGTLVTDTVRFRAPLAALVTAYFVRPDVERIFRFRFDKLAALFG